MSIRVFEVKDQTATLNVDGILLCFMLREQKGKLKPHMFAKSGFGGTQIPRKVFQQAQRQAAAILKKKRKEEEKNSTHP